MADPKSELDRRLEALRGGAAYRNFQYVRDRVVEMKAAAAVAGEKPADSSVADPSSYWTDELRNIEYMIDAGPLVVDRLRQHTYHVTGVWSYHYRPHQDRRRHRHGVKLKALHRLHRPHLFVPESPELGGFGFSIGEQLVNVDTLKFYEALIALDQGEVLGELKELRRATVWEIGAGWGGFAYQFKTLFPRTTYVISDLPELFLFSATYLLTLFPDATFSFYGDGNELDWNADFVFVPHTNTDAITPPALDLAVNMVSFQEMTTDQVRHYVQHAAAQNTPFFYSLNRDRSPYNPELTSVRELLSEDYWLRPVEVLTVPYTDMPDEIPKANPKAARARLRSGALGQNVEDLTYKHVVGWLRIAK